MGSSLASSLGSTGSGMAVPGGGKVSAYNLLPNCHSVELKLPKKGGKKNEVILK
jgi:hypothetical protein